LIKNTLKTSVINCFFIIHILLLLLIPDAGFLYYQWLTNVNLANFLAMLTAF